MSWTISRVMSWVIIYLAFALPRSSSDLPETQRAAVWFQFGLASSGVYRACSVTRTAVSSYLAFPPLLPKGKRFISVALAWELPPPDVIRHSALWSPDFPHLHPFVYAAAITCPTHINTYTKIKNESKVKNKK